jgi:hypothetical protein
MPIIVRHDGSPIMAGLDAAAGAAANGIAGQAHYDRMMRSYQEYARNIDPNSPGAQPPGAAPRQPRVEDVKVRQNTGTPFGYPEPKEAAVPRDLAADAGLNDIGKKGGDDLADAAGLNDIGKKPVAEKVEPEGPKLSGGLLNRASTEQAVRDLAFDPTPVASQKAASSDKPTPKPTEKESSADREPLPTSKKDHFSDGDFPGLGADVTNPGFGTGQ